MNMTVSEFMKWLSQILGQALPTLKDVSGWPVIKAFWKKLMPFGGTTPNVPVNSPDDVDGAWPVDGTWTLIRDHDGQPLLVGKNLFINVRQHRDSP